jgi:hypothetical protein
VRLLEQGGKEASQLVREIGVRRNQLYKWQAEIALHSEDAFPVHGGRPKIQQLSKLKLSVYKWGMKFKKRRQCTSTMSSIKVHFR